jgi:hypothetical protein
VVEFGFGDVGFVFGGREGEDGRGVEDCGGWEGDGGEDAAALRGGLLVGGCCCCRLVWMGECRFGVKGK